MLRRIDTDALKRSRPIGEVVAGYGIDLRPRGRTLAGRCPFHSDGGRPNLYVYPATDSFFCYRCGIGGDAITFVERLDGIGFRDAVARLTGAALSVSERQRPSLDPRRRRVRSAPWGPEERSCLAAAVELYHNRLLTDPRALAYIEGRGLQRETLDQCRVGYAAGNELAAYLYWRGVPARAALRTGLLRRGGDELMAGRIVVPEIRGGRSIWLIGREINDSIGPKYLGLPGPKRLLGWEAASRGQAVSVVEGVFDWLILQQWGVPSLAVLGTHVRPEVVEALGSFEQIYLVLDSDPAGQEATERLLSALSPRAVSVTLAGVKDVAELATRPDGAIRFSRAIAEAAQPIAA